MRYRKHYRGLGHHRRHGRGGKRFSRSYQIGRGGIRL
ncbi:MAG: hypothetical protein Pg6B_10480 [Candidatus Azobacteroides pseudotrichonymphae]|nr:MAG: hypothetical protein Pg6B_10430 [Candidatus Azobacteroides pseudotrichonymphae]GMO38236.1 MAG: hypothetical protein Pg6B_10480 [Candidatus Azobacteroides pseudotrichonymphae]